MPQLLVPRLPAHVLQVLGAMSVAGAPAFGIYLAALVFASGLVTEHPELDGVEYFAGRAAVTTALQNEGLRVYAYERDTDALVHDIMGDTGFAHALALLLRIRRGGIVWLLSIIGDRVPCPKTFPIDPSDSLVSTRCSRGRVSHMSSPCVRMCPCSCLARLRGMSRASSSCIIR
jgi:hypothetical protein